MQLSPGMSLGDAYSHEARVLREAFDRRMETISHGGKDMGMILGVFLAGVCLTMGAEAKPEAHAALDDLCHLVHRIIDTIVLVDNDRFGGV